MAKQSITYTIKCTKLGCPFKREDIESKSDAKRHKAAHESNGHEVTIHDVEGLPRAVLVGDRIKVKEDAAPSIIEACKRAQWEFDARKVRTVTSIDSQGPGNSDRLFFEGPPFCLMRNQVQLAWNSEKERREGLGK